MTKLLLYCFFILSCFQVFSQETETLILYEEIVFVGNDNTQSSYLLQNISCRPKTPLSSSDIEDAISQLRNLPSIANVTYDIESDGLQSVLKFNIEERRTKLPIINIGGIKDNIWFGLGLIENNFRGKGNLLLAYYQNTDSRHSIDLYYKNPRMLQSDWGYSASLRKWSSNEPLYFPEGIVQYLYDNNSVSISLIKNFGLRTQLELGSTLFKESYRQAENQELSVPPGPIEFSINKYLTKFHANHNKLFYSFFYLKGYSVNLTAQNVYNFDDGTFFNSLELRGKAFFRPTPKINIGTRLIFAVSTNDESPFAPFVADSRVNIRGIGNRIDRGTAQTVLNLEARRTIYHKHQWASQLVVFSDLGTWRSPGGEIKDLVNPRNFRHYIGVGIRLSYLKIFGATLRVDYGVDLYNLEERGFVLGLGQYF